MSLPIFMTLYSIGIMWCLVSLFLLDKMKRPMKYATIFVSIATMLLIVIRYTIHQ